jgi:phosphoglycolate phosphatase
VKLLITDLDDTIYNWSAFYIPSFLAMLGEIHRITGVDKEALKRSFKRVHERHRTTEYAFAIQELDVLAEIDRGLSVEQRLAKYERAIVAFRRMRKGTLRLFPGVSQTLDRLATAGIPVVGVSDSMMSYVSRRLRQLDVDLKFSAVCAPADHGLPEGLSPEMVRKVRGADVVGRMAEIPLSARVRKPDVQLIEPILKHFGVEAPETVVVGDSLSRDVLMARRIGAVDVWAEYGQKRDAFIYEELLKITYWSDAEVADETALQAEARVAPPTYSISAFEEVLPVLNLIR